MPFSYANPTSGPSAGGIGWFTFENLTITPGTTLTNLTGTLSDGSTVTFDLRLELTSGQPRTFVAVPTPTFNNAPFGTLGYTGISGNSALYSDFNYSGPGVNTFTIDNIVVKDSLNNPITNYTLVLADSETTSFEEGWEWNTDGGVWKLLSTLGNNPPNVTGIGTQNVTITGFQLFPEVTNASFVMTTQSPNKVVVTSIESISGRQSFNIGFALTKLKLQKNVGYRIDSNDQFVLDINGTLGEQVTTSGTSTGIQSQFAMIYPIAGNTYTIDESMANGSGSMLHDYNQVINVANATPAGSIPPITSLPIQYTPALGDDVTYTIINAAPEVITKEVDKAYADINEVLTYRITVDNPNDFPINNVLVTDVTPSGTSYIGNLFVSAPYIGIDMESGITITTINASSSVIITWQVQVNTFPPIPNPVPNYANVNIPDGTSGMSNIVTTQVNTAFVGILKSVDKAFANIGDILTYTFTLHNAGNVSANNVVITDILPNGTSYIVNSLIGATGTPPTMMLNNPIGPNESATVSFQVVIAGKIPSPNPITNMASVSYTYSVDPNNPNAAQRSEQSNEVQTQVNHGDITFTKLVDTAYASTNDTLKYTFQLKNTGNVSVNTLEIHDVIPIGTTYVANSLIGATGTPPTLTLVQPIAPNDTAIVSFQVLVDSMLPSTNPIVNQAQISYTYTVDPLDPNGGSGNLPSNPVETQINLADIEIIKASDPSYVDTNGVITYTLTLFNKGNVTANNITIQDIIPSGATFLNGSLFGATGTPPLLTLTNSLLPGATEIITFQVQVGDQVPNTNPLVNTASANYTFIVNPNNPVETKGDSQGNTVSTQVNHAEVIITKAVDLAYAKPTDIITYTLTLQNIGNIVAKNIIIHEPLPQDTTYVTNSLVGASGNFPTLTLNTMIAPNETATITFQVRVNKLPVTNPISNQATIEYDYLVDPITSELTKGIKTSNTVNTQIQDANLTVVKSVDNERSYPNDMITYTLALTNNGNVNANNVVIHDVLPNGVQYINNSLQANVMVSGTPPTIQLLQPIAPNTTITLRFQVRVIEMPNPNPIINQATITYSFILDPNKPEVLVTVISNEVCTIVFRNRYAQQISDLISSIAYQQASLSAIMNAEGAKIQKMVADEKISEHELLCLNQSINEMLLSISILEQTLKQKQDIVACQINGSCHHDNICH